MLSLAETVSAFAGKGKLKALKVMLKSEIYITTFTLLCTLWQLKQSLMEQLERLTCGLYHIGEDVNLLRYRMYCSKSGKVQMQMLVV